MAARVKSAAVVGIDAVIIEAEAEVARALRRFTLVGLPDGVVKEAKDRVRCAIQSSGFEFPHGDVVVSLAPAWLPKLGSGFDLAIAVAILAAAGIIPHKLLERFVLVGELSLDGSIKPVGGVIQAAAAAARIAQKEKKEFELLVAEKNCTQAACIGGISAVPVANLLETVMYLRGEAVLKPLTVADIAAPPDPLEQPNFSDVVGQHGVIRAMQVGAAGGHNLLMVGPPGSGKSMLASRYPALLPPMSLADAIEVTKIAAAADFDGSPLRSSGGGRDWGLIRRRPFRAPHHSASLAGIIGGGPTALPGEVTLAHRGILFLDELSEFRREVLESLRQPLEAKRVVVSRARMRISYPADFLLVAAMNPCPCGRRGVQGGGCQCGPAALRSFQRRLSGPILDRIDLQVWVPPVPTAQMLNGELTDQTARLAAEVAAARRIQFERFSGERLNNSISSIELKKWCVLEPEGKRLIEKASAKQMLSARAISRIIKTARTIADLAEEPAIKLSHLAEALSYRTNDLGAEEP